MAAARCPNVTGRRMPWAWETSVAKRSAARRAPASPLLVTVVRVSSRNSPSSGTTEAGCGTTAVAAAALTTIRLAARAKARRMREKGGRSTRDAPPSRGASTPGRTWSIVLQLVAQREVVLPPVRVEGARLVGVGAVVLEDRVVEVQPIEVDGKILVDLVAERSAERSRVVLVLRRAAVQAHEEVRAVRVREPRA